MNGSPDHDLEEQQFSSLVWARDNLASGKALVGNIEAVLFASCTPGREGGHPGPWQGIKQTEGELQFSVRQP